MPATKTAHGACCAPSLLDALTSPHGVDRYVELVRPLASPSTRSAPRSPRSAARPRGASRSTLAPTRNWAGFRAGQFVNLTVEIDGVRAHPLLLAGRAPRTRPAACSS